MRLWRQCLGQTRDVSVVTERDGENEESAMEALVTWWEVHGVRHIACR